MSDIEDLAEGANIDNDPPDRSGTNLKRVASGFRLGKLQLAGAHAANRNPDRLRLSSSKPTLPKLKFLEGSDD